MPTLTVRVRASVAKLKALRHLRSGAALPGSLNREEAALLRELINLPDFVDPVAWLRSERAEQTARLALSAAFMADGPMPSREAVILAFRTARNAVNRDSFQPYDSESQLLFDLWNLDEEDDPLAWVLREHGWLAANIALEQLLTWPIHADMG